MKESNEFNFFTGKPGIEDLGYAFLFRNCQANTGKWQTSDPLGYPDGWNNLAYVNNGVTMAIDWLGGLEVSGESYIEEKVTYNLREDLSEWTADGIVTTANGNKYQRYKKSVRYYDLVEEYTVTPYYDSFWKTTTEAIAVGIGASIGAALGSIVPGVGTIVGVVTGAGAGAVVSYLICESISVNPTRLVRSEKPINSYRRNIREDVIYDYKRIE